MTPLPDWTIQASVTSLRFPRTLAITGLDSLVGQRLAERLLAASTPPTLVGFDLRLPRRLEGRMRFHRVDLTEPTADSRLAELLEKERCEALVHAAFFKAPGVEREYMHELEVIGSLHVMNACAAAGVGRLVVISTAQTYGPHADNPGFLTEAHPLRPHAEAYSIQDRAELEGLLRVFSERHRGMNVVVLKPCGVMGPNADSLLVQHLSGAAVTTVMGFDPLMQFLHEEDLLHALQLALIQDVRGSFNLAGEGVLPLSTLLRLAGKRSVPVPHPMLYRLAYLPWLSRTGEVPAAFYDHLRFGWVVDTARAKTLLGFEPTYSTKEAWLSFVVSRRMRSYR